MKKIISLCISFAMVFSFFSPLKVYAEENQPENETSLNSVVSTDHPEYEYELNENNYATITKYSGNEKDVVIPDTLDGYTVTGLEGAFDFNEGLNSVEIPDTVTSIGEYAFDHCVSLKSVKMPEKLVTIERQAFHMCIALNEIVIPEYDRPSATGLSKKTFCNIQG